MKRATCVIAFLTLLLCGCFDSGLVRSPSTESGSPDLALGGTDRPFQGHWETMFSEFNPLGTIRIQGVGNGTHLGLSTFDTLQPLFPGVPFTAALIASSGDELHYTAIGDPIQDPGADPFVFSATLLFTGGTGRFSDATGSATYEGTASLVTMTGEVTYTGTISY